MEIRYQNFIWNTFVSGCQWVEFSNKMIVFRIAKYPKYFLVYYFTILFFIDHNYRMFKGISI